jgi:hypothetical protein
MIKAVLLRPGEPDTDRKEWGCDVYVLMEDGWHHKRFPDTVATFGIDLFERIYRGYYEDWVPSRWPLTEEPLPSETGSRNK